MDSRADQRENRFRQSERGANRRTVPRSASFEGGKKATIIQEMLQEQNKAKESLIEEEKKE